MMSDGGEIQTQPGGELSCGGSHRCCSTVVRSDLSRDPAKFWSHLRYVEKPPDSLEKVEVNWDER